MSEEERPWYSDPESHPHYKIRGIDHSDDGDQGGKLPPDSDSEIVSPPSEPTVKIENVVLNGKRLQRIILNEGTRDEIKLMGRVYGLKPGVMFRNIPAEKRDSEEVGVSGENQFFFKVNGHDRIENGIAYFWGFFGRNNGIGKLPTLVVAKPVVVEKQDIKRTGKKS